MDSGVFSLIATEMPKMLPSIWVIFRGSLMGRACYYASDSVQFCCCSALQRLQGKPIVRLLLAVFLVLVALRHRLLCNGRILLARMMAGLVFLGYSAKHCAMPLI